MKLKKFSIAFFLLLALLVTVASAQETTTAKVEEAKTTNEAPAKETSTNAVTTAQEVASTGANQDPTSVTQKVNTAKTTQTTKAEETTTEGPPPPLTTSTSISETPTATDDATTATSTDSSSLPPLPKLTTTAEYPPPTVPPTTGAPYMKKSSLPEGTFFIAVGAALGFLLFSVFAWRMVVAWSLHRSVRRAAEQANAADSKAMLRPPPNGHSGGFYAAGAGSAVSLGDLSRGGAAAKPTPNSSLFFSPTAGVGAPGERRSTYLPAGYYPSSGNGSGSLGPNASQTQFQHPGSSRYNSYDRRGLAPSPPGSPLISPSMPPSRGGNGSPVLRGSESRTSLSLPPMAGQRAPSAYLEDLFENHQQLPGRY